MVSDWCIYCIYNHDTCTDFMMASILRLYRSSPWFNVLKTAKPFSVHSRYSKSLYDSLGVTPKATQFEIKAAYYKLSKIYHPDKNEGSQEAANKFRDITEAYEVLGNLRLRKRYDRGILYRDNQETRSTATEEADESYSKFYESRTYRSRPPTVSKQAPVYDFDEWARAHYAASFARKQAAKQEYTKQADQNAYEERIQRQELYSYCVVTLLIAIVLGAFSSNDYDDVQICKSSPGNFDISSEDK